MSESIAAPCHGCCCTWSIVILVLGVAIYLLRRWIIGPSWQHDEYKMHKKVVIITGANTGIGKATAVDLAKRGAKVYLACRDKGRGEAAQQEIRDASGSQNVFYRSLDLSSMTSVREFVKQFLKEESQLHVLINNAGMVSPKYKETEDGIEMQMSSNHMGHFLLTNLLLDVLKKSAPSRIINVSSLGHWFGKIDRADFMSKKKDYKPFMVYCNTKLANILFTRELSKHLLNTGVTVNVLHPGVVATDIGKSRRSDKKDDKFLFKVWLWILVFFAKSSEHGALTTIRLAVDPELEKTTGKYFNDFQVARNSKRSQNDDDALWLWNESVKYTKLNTK